MSRKKNVMLIDGRNKELVRVAITGNNFNHLYDLNYYNEFEYGKGSIHLGIVERVFPALQAVFVKYKDGKNGFLPFAEIDPNYLSNNILNHDIVEGEYIDKELLSYSLKEDFPDLDISDLDDNNTPDNMDGKGFICKNQPIIVQIIKEERGTKGAMLSTFIHLEGQYCTLIPNRNDKTGINTVNNLGMVERKRIQVLLQNIEIPENGSIIINSSGSSASMQEITDDIAKLNNIWNSIKKKANISGIQPNIESSHKVLHYDFNLVKDIFNNKGGMFFQSIIIDSHVIYEEVIKFLKSYMPHFLNLVKLHDDIVPIFDKYHVEKLINDEMKNIVSLKSGGYIVIHITEALVSIDVNSGKNRDELSIEETAFKTNIEAVQEVLKQVKLRKLCGLIVVDLIGMRNPENINAIEGIARRISHTDRSKMQISIVPEFSILIISKQRLEQNLHEIRDIKCEHCNGFGFVKNIKFNIYELFNDIRAKFVDNEKANFKIIAGAPLIEKIMNEYRNNIDEIEKEIDGRIIFNFDNNIKDNAYIIEKIVITQSIASTNTAENTVIPAIQNIVINEEVFSDLSEMEKKSYNLMENHNSRNEIVEHEASVFAKSKQYEKNFDRKKHKINEDKVIDKNSVMVGDNNLLCVWDEWVSALINRSN